MDNYLTVKDVQGILRIGKTKMYELIKQDDFPKIQIGKQYLIPETELDKFLKKYLYKKYTY